MKVQLSQQARADAVTVARLVRKLETLTVTPADLAARADVPSATIRSEVLRNTIPSTATNRHRVIARTVADEYAAAVARKRGKGDDNTATGES